MAEMLEVGQRVLINSNCKVDNEDGSHHIPYAQVLERMVVGRQGRVTAINGDYVRVFLDHKPHDPSCGDEHDYHISEVSCVQ